MRLQCGTVYTFWGKQRDTELAASRIAELNRQQRVETEIGDSWYIPDTPKMREQWDEAYIGTRELVIHTGQDVEKYRRAMAVQARYPDDILAFYAQVAANREKTGVWDVSDPPEHIRDYVTWNGEVPELGMDNPLTARRVLDALDEGRFDSRTGRILDISG